MSAREKPILFSGPMIRAIIDGRKTMTRRLIKPQPDESKVNVKNIPSGFLKCPYQVGMNLWVKEIWSQPFKRTEHHTGVIFAADGPTYNSPASAKHQWPKEMKGVWKPSIFMPRWASRITLEVLSIKVERLQEISEEDAEKEGMDGHCPEDKLTWKTPKEQFQKLWDSLNGKKYPWALNPFVWVISFRRLT